MYIHKLTVGLSEQHNLTYKSFHELLNHRSPGLRMEQDIVTNSNAKAGFLITGLNPKSAEAIGLIAREYNLEIVSLDIAFVSPVAHSTIARAEYLDYHFQVERLKKHLSDQKYVGNHGSYTHFGIHHYAMGAEKSIKQLLLQDKISPPGEVEALQIVWRLRQGWAKEAWSYIQKADTYDLGIDLGFMAATNTFLGPDWFQLGHDQRVILTRISKPVVQKPVEEDWRVHIDRALKCFGKNQTDPYEVLDLIAEYISHAYALV